MTPDEIAEMQADALAWAGEWGLNYEKGDNYYRFISTKGPSVQVMEATITAQAAEIAMLRSVVEKHCEVQL